MYIVVEGFTPVSYLAGHQLTSDTVSVFPAHSWDAEDASQQGHKEYLV